MQAHSSEECVQELRSIGNQVLVILVDGVYSEDSILSDERVSVFLLAISACHGCGNSTDQV
jgi:hypothetical protein